MSCQGVSQCHADSLGALAAAVGSEPQPTPNSKSLTTRQHGGPAGMEGFADSEDQDIYIPPAPAAVAEPAPPMQQAVGQQQQVEQQQVEQQQEAHGQQVTSQAARLYVKESEAREVEVHPTVVERFNDIPDDLVRSYNPWGAPRASAGGAAVLLSDIPDLSMKQLLTALQALLGGDRGFEDKSDSPVAVVHHLGFSQMDADVLKYIADAASHSRLFHWFPLQSLELAGCGLAAEEFRTLYSATHLLRHLHRLELRDNNFQVDSIVPIITVQDLFRTAPLQYLGLENTGLSNEAWDWLLRRLVVSQLPTPQPRGTLPHLQVLRVGPPTDGPLLCERAASHLLELLDAAPQLQGLVVHGLSEQHQEALAAKWRELKGDGAAFCGQLGEQGGFRLSIKPLDEVLPAEVSPTEHTLPGPETPPQQQGVGERSPVDDAADFLGRPATAEGGGLIGGLYLPQLPGAAQTPVGCWAAPGGGALLPPAGGQQQGHSAALCQAADPPRQRRQQQLQLPSLPNHGLAERTSQPLPKVAAHARGGSQQPRAGPYSNMAEMHEMLAGINDGTAVPSMRQTLLMGTQQAPGRGQHGQRQGQGQGQQQRAAGEPRQQQGQQWRGAGAVAGMEGPGWQPPNQHAAGGGSNGGAGGSKGAGSKRGSGGGGNKRGGSRAGVPRAYGPEDLLERLDCGIDLEQEESPAASEDESLEDVAAQAEKDQAAKLDDKLRKPYRKQATEAMNMIRDPADLKRAKNFIWTIDNGSYSWDRNRFAFPSKDPIDISREPDVRAAYVGLYHILKEHGMQLEFPIPDWVFKKVEARARQKLQEQQQQPAANNVSNAGGRRARGAEAHRLHKKPRRQYAPGMVMSEGEGEGALAGGRQRGRSSGEAASQDCGGHSSGDSGGSAGSGEGGGGGSRRRGGAQGGTTVRKKQRLVVDSDDDESSSDEEEQQRLQPSDPSASSGGGSGAAASLQAAAGMGAQEATPMPGSGSALLGVGGVGAPAAAGGGASESPCTAAIQQRCQQLLGSQGPSPQPALRLNPGGGSACPAALDLAQAQAAVRTQLAAPSALQQQGSQQAQRAEQQQQQQRQQEPGVATATAGGGAAGKGDRSKRAARELEALKPFNWDKQKDDYPPNAEHFMPAEGKRARVPLPPAALGSEDPDNPTQLTLAADPNWAPTQEGEEMEGEAAALGRGQTQQEQEQGEQGGQQQLAMQLGTDPEDDLPLIQLIARRRAVQQQQGGAEVGRQAGTEPAAAPSPSLLPAAVQPSSSPTEPAQPAVQGTAPISEAEPAATAEEAPSPAPAASLPSAFLVTAAGLALPSPELQPPAATSLHLPVPEAAAAPLGSAAQHSPAAAGEGLAGCEGHSSPAGGAGAIVEAGEEAMGEGALGSPAPAAHNPGSAGHQQQEQPWQPAQEPIPDSEEEEEQQQRGEPQEATAGAHVTDFSIIPDSEEQEGFNLEEL